MSRIEIAPGEPLEKALRRFKKKIERDGVLKQLKARKHYEKPSEKKRRKMRSKPASSRTSYR
jgi:small subunit ribosomal protein S21